MISIISDEGTKNMIYIIIFTLPMIITIFLILAGDKIKDFLSKLKIGRKLEKTFKNVDAPMQLLFSILLFTLIFSSQAYILICSSTIKEIISSFALAVVSVIIIFKWNENYI